ncbi:Ubiquinone biosynthesis O-methyltransferase [subsurface metagenome]
MSCILCSSNAYQELRTIKEYKIVKCAQCTFVYAHPLPKMDELTKIYSQHIPEKFKPHKGLVRRYKYYFLTRSIKKHFPKDKQIRLLEIGCSYGRLLSSLQLDKQFKAIGIDLTDVSLKYARRLGLNVLKGTLESQAFANESYDVVVALQTIEHVLDPIRLLTEINRILSKGGIFVATVPCVTHIKAKIAGMKWKYYAPPGHLWYFSPRTFKLLFSKTGFQPVTVTCFFRKAYLKIIAKKAVIPT